MWVWGELGYNYFEIGKLDKAAAAYKAQLKKTPENAMALNNLGMIYKLQFHYRQAMEYFGKAVAADPMYADAYYNLGFISFEEGDLDGAIENYKKAIEINPEFNLARESLAVAVRRQEAYAHQNFSWKKK
jgi:Tfp pilus assembly protein PilF